MKQRFVQTIASHQPTSFQLVTNFRSHGGIVRCAHSVIVLITKFWPYAIDILPEEKGIVNGIKPVFFSGWDQDNVRYESFLFGTASVFTFSPDSLQLTHLNSGHHIEFGAQQCILVRNDAAREKLRRQVGNIGLIMCVLFEARSVEILKACRTLYESKGLEFNDVSPPPVGTESMAIELSRSSFTTSLRTRVSMSLNGVLFSTRSTVPSVKRSLLQRSMKIAMLAFAPRFVSQTR